MKATGGIPRGNTWKPALTLFCFMFAAISEDMNRGNTDDEAGISKYTF